MSDCHSISVTVFQPTTPAPLNGRVFEGKKNGELLRAAEAAGYDVLLTVDQGIRHERHSAGRRLSIILVRSRTNQIEDLLPLASAIVLALETIQPG